jgi:hypothetical protein
LTVTSREGKGHLNKCASETRLEFATVRILVRLCGPDREREREAAESSKRAEEGEQAGTEELAAKDEADRLVVEHKKKLKWRRHS